MPNPPSLSPLPHLQSHLPDDAMAEIRVTQLDTQQTHLTEQTRLGDGEAERLRADSSQYHRIQMLARLEKFLAREEALLERFVAEGELHTSSARGELHTSSAPSRFSQTAQDLLHSKRAFG